MTRKDIHWHPVGPTVGFHAFAAGHITPVEDEVAIQLEVNALRTRRNHVGRCGLDKRVPVIVELAARHHTGMEIHKPHRVLNKVGVC